MTKQITTYIIGIILGWSAYAQVLAPAPAQSEPIAIMNATAHLGNGEVIENSIITFKEGKITLVADATRVRVDLKGYRLIDAAGKHAYPGVILPLTNLGLVEYEAVKASRDFSETGNLKPHVRTAYCLQYRLGVDPYHEVQWNSAGPGGSKKWSDRRYQQYHAVGRLELGGCPLSGRRWSPFELALTFLWCQMVDGRD